MVASQLDDDSYQERYLRVALLLYSILMIDNIRLLLRMWFFRTNKNEFVTYCYLSDESGGSTMDGLKRNEIRSYKEWMRAVRKKKPRSQEFPSYLACRCEDDEISIVQYFITA